MLKNAKQLLLFVLFLLAVGSIIFAGYIHRIPEEFLPFLDFYFYTGFWWYYGLRMVLAIILARLLLTLLVLTHFLKEGYRPSEVEEALMFSFLGLAFFFYICLGFINTVALLSTCFLFYAIAAKLATILSGGSKPSSFPKSYCELIDATMEFSIEKLFRSDARSLFTGLMVLIVASCYFFGIGLNTVRKEKLVKFSHQDGTIEGSLLGQSKLNYFISVPETYMDVEPYWAGKCSTEKFLVKWIFSTGISKECVDPPRGERTRHKILIMPTHAFSSIRQTKSDATNQN